MLSAQKYGKNLHVNYSPFGTTLYGRNWSSEKYRYGFNSQEKDDEVSGAGNSYAAEFWQYSSRLAVRWNLDPKPNPAISPYATFARNPVLYTDSKGDTIKLFSKLFEKLQLTHTNQSAPASFEHAGKVIMNSSAFKGLMQNFATSGQAGKYGADGAGVMSSSNIRAATHSPADNNANSLFNAVAQISNINGQITVTLDITFSYRTSLSSSDVLIETAQLAALANSVINLTNQLTNPNGAQITVAQYQAQLAALNNGATGFSFQGDPFFNTISNDFVSTASTQFNTGRTIEESTGFTTLGTNPVNAGQSAQGFSNRMNNLTAIPNINNGAGVNLMVDPNFRFETNYALISWINHFQIKRAQLP